MPYVQVWVDAERDLGDFDTEELEAEINRRRNMLLAKNVETGAHDWTSIGLAEDLRTAFYARDTSRFETLLCVLDDGRFDPPPPAAADARAGQH